MEANNYFTFSSHVHDLLFKNFTVSSIGAFFAVCVGVAIFVCLYEFLQSVRHHLVLTLESVKEASESSTVPPASSQRTFLNWITYLPKKKIRRIKFHCLQTVLHMLQLLMGYIIMLIVMNYNAWLLITVVTTSSICYYFHDILFARKPLIVPVEVPGSSL